MYEVYFSLFLVFSILFFPFSFANGNHEKLNLRYDVIQNGQKIGEINAKRTIIGNKTYYELKSIMTIKLVVRQLLTYDETIVFKNGELESSIFKSYVNNKIYNYCKITWNGKHYEIHKDKIIDHFDKIVKYSRIMLYFKEPFGITYTFSEMTGSYNKINRIGENEYTLTDNQSKKVNKYWYKDGFLSKAYINHTLIDLEIKHVY